MPGERAAVEASGDWLEARGMARGSRGGATGDEEIVRGSETV